MDENSSAASRGNDRPQRGYGSQASFEARLQFGGAAEEAIERWAGEFAVVLPLARLPASDGHGPRLLTPAGQLTAPDMALVVESRVVFLELKRRTSPNLHRRTAQWVTGVEQRDFERLLRFQAATRSPVFLGFLHDNDAPGLRGDHVLTLQDTIHHEAAGMIYWHVEELPILRPENFGHRAEPPRLDYSQLVFE